MYVDDLVTERGNLQEVEKIKSDSIELFKKGGFKLHKWHSNEPNLETLTHLQKNISVQKRIRLKYWA